MPRGTRCTGRHPQRRPRVHATARPDPVLINDVIGSAHDRMSRLGLLDLAVLALFTVGDVYASLCKKKSLRSIYRAAKVTSAILAVI